MKARHIAISAALAALAAAPAAHAATANITVSANIVAACSFTTPSGTVWNFGDLASDKQSDAKKTFSLAYRCASGAPYTVKIAGSSTGTANGNMSKTGSMSRLPYTLTWVPTAGKTGQGTTNDIILNVDATILKAAINAAEMGAYNDQVTVEVNAD